MRSHEQKMPVSSGAKRRQNRVQGPAVSYPGFDDWFVAELERHLPALRKRAAGLTRGAHQGDDIAQTACLKAWKSRASFDPDQEMYPWLCAILKNVWNDELRKQRGRNAHVSPLSDETEVAEPETMPASDMIDLRRAVSALPRASRELILLRAVLGLSHEEVGALLDVTPVTARKAYSRAVARLREITSAPNQPADDDSTRTLLEEAQALRTLLAKRKAA